MNRREEIMKTRLFIVMKLSGDYADDDCIIEIIEEMRDEVARGRDPGQVLQEEGFESDYISDIIP